ncbi:MAG: hypothetical protein AYL28_000430 [Candidatus Bathyarchaeota archaeon B23]|nr:MAG: hypothetical protein AYL28_000430 [Candidatus Bathyarchaeota archaeon B23]
MVELIVKVRIGKRRTLVIPKSIAESLDLDEGSMVEMRVMGEELRLKPIRDAVWLSLHGEKIAKITLKELEEESVERQKEVIEGT